MTSTIINRTISLPPKFLDSNVKVHIQDIVNKEVNTCSREYGYIISILRLISCNEGTVSPTSSNILFNVKFEAETVKPESNSIFEGTVIMIDQNGIMVGVKDILKILVPHTQIKGLKYDSTTNSYRIIMSNKKSIEKNDVIKVKITDIRYSRNNYSCIGTLNI